MKISGYATNEELEIQGVWSDIGQGARVKVARDNNPKFVSMLRSKMSSYKTEIQRLNLGDEEAESILSEILAETVLLDWENIDDDDGKSIPYSKENATKLLNEYKEFKSLIVQLSANVEAFRTQHVKKVIDNLKK